MGVVKTWNGIARASVKTFDGIAAASVKTINGFDAATGTTYTLQETFGADTNDAVLAASAANRTYIGGQFTPATSYTITAIEWYGRRITDGGSAGTLTCTIRSISGGVTTTTVLKTADATIASADVGTANQWIRVTFATGLSVTGSTTYSFVLGAGSVSATNYYIWRGGAISSGAFDSSTADASWATLSTRAPRMRTYVSP